MRLSTKKAADPDYFGPLPDYPIVLELKASSFFESIQERGCVYTQGGFFSYTRLWTLRTFFGLAGVTWSPEKIDEPTLYERVSQCKWFRANPFYWACIRPDNTIAVLCWHDMP